MDILPAITGGFAGSLITLGLQSTIRYWNRPILVVDNDTKGSDLLPTGYLSDYEGNILKDTQGSSRYVKQHYLRLRIANLGNTFAKNVSACITSITYRRSGTDTVFDAEVFELKLALTKDRAVFDVAAKGHRFLDLVHCHEEKGVVSSDLLFDFVKTSSILPSFGSGVYEVSVFVAAENAQSISRDFKWTWDGTLQGLKFTPRRHRHAWGLSTGWSGDKMGQ